MYERCPSLSIQLFHCFHQPLPHLEGILYIRLEVFLPIPALVFLIKKILIITGIVFELIGVIDIQKLIMSHDLPHSGRSIRKDHRIVIRLHHILRTVHGIDQSCGNDLVPDGLLRAVLPDIGPYREEPALNEGSDLTGRIAIIDRRANDNHVSFMNLLQGRTEIVLVGAQAIRLAVFDLAGETADAAFVLIVIEADGLHLGSSCFRTPRGTLQSLVRIPVLSRASVYDDRLNSTVSFLYLLRSFMINTPLIVPNCMYLCSLCRAEKIQSPNAGYYVN